MGLQFVIGGSGAGKSHIIYEQMIESAKADSGNFLIVVPDQFTMQTQKDLCTFPTNDREGIMNIDVLSFSRLCHRIMEEMGQQSGVMLDDTGKNLVLSRVATSKKDELKVLGANLHKIGYIHEIKSMLSEFYQYAIGKEELDELIKYATKKGALSYKLKDLQIIREAFNDYIRDKYITTEELLDKLCQLLPKSNIVKDSIVVFDGFTGFTPIQNKVIGQLMLQAREVIVTLVADELADIEDESKTEEQLFYLSHHTYKTLTGIARKSDVDLRNTIVVPRENDLVKRFQNNAELGFLEKNLFRNKKNVYTGETNQIFVTEAASPKREVQSMLVQIKKLVRKEGYAYRDIAVVAGNMETYQHLLMTEFEHYNVPVYMDQTRDILHHPLSEFIRAMVDLIVNDFSRESVFCFLRTALTDLSVYEIDQLELYVERFGIRGKSKYEKLFVKGADIYSPDELASINASRQKMMDLLEPVLRFGKNKRDKASKIVEAIYAVLVNADLQQKMEALREKFEACDDLVRASEYGQIYKAVIDLLNQIHSLLGEDEMEFATFSEVLESGLCEISIGTIPQNVDLVVAGDIERTRLKQVKALFFIGINDGAVPKSGKAGGILSDMEREFLQGAGHELAPTPRQQIFMQRLYLYLNMTKPSEKLFLSYCIRDNEGNSLRKSYLINVMQKMFSKLKFISDGKLGRMEHIAGKNDGLDDLAELMAMYANQSFIMSKEEEGLFFALVDSYLQNGERQLIEEFMEAAFYCYEDKNLSKELAKALYGEIIESSVGRLEKFCSCAYAHFLQYGMKLRESSEYEVSYADIGTIYHDVMKRFSEFLKENSYHWGDFPMDEAEEFVDKLLERMAREYNHAMFYESAESLGVVNEMGGVLKRSIKTLRYQIGKGLFEPKYFELPFYHGDRIKTKGRIDRVDTFEKDGELYIKVVDYKSGKKEFDPVEFYFGLNMQLAVYMRAALEMEGQKEKDKKVVPAALVYYQLKNPFVDVKAGELTGGDGSIMLNELEDKIRKEMKFTGLISEDAQVILALDQEFEKESDIMTVKCKKDGSYTGNSIVASRERFEFLMKYVDYKIEEVADKVYEGNIQMRPYKMGEQNACTFCSFQDACHFDRKIEGCQYEDMDTMTEEEVWEKMESISRKE